LRPPHRLDRAFLQRAKQFSPGGGQRQFADFVEEQRAAGGFDEFARMAFRWRRVKGTLLVAETGSTPRDYRGDGAAIDCNERLRFALTAAMDGGARETIPCRRRILLR